MRKTVTLLIFPYFAPLVALSVLAFAYLLATPLEPLVGTGPADSDVVGLYFIGICIVVGGVLQVVVGLPLNALILRSSRFDRRLIMSVGSVFVPVLLYLRLMRDSSTAPPFADALGIGVVVVTFGLGAWFVFSTVNQTNPN